VSLSERILRVRHEIQRRAVGTGTAYAFLTGSLVEGFGNANSDIDLIVVGAAPDPSAPAGAVDRRFDFGDVVVELSHVGEERIDVESWPRDRVERLVAAAHGLRDGGAGGLDQYAFKLLHQLRVGIPVAGHRAMEELRFSIPWDDVAERLRRIAEAAYVGHAEDAAGAVKSGDAATAMVTSRSALGCAVDCLVAAHGHTNPQPKWRYRKLAALGLDGTVARCLAAECDAGVDGLLAGSKRRLLLAQELVAEAGQYAASRPRQLNYNTGGPPEDR
jgi:hypothetical protein